MLHAPSRNYREMLQAYYSDKLKCYQLHKDLEKEKRLMLKYFNRNYLPLFPPDKDISVLDVGCGRGFYMSALLSNGYKNVHGIDFS